MIPYLLFIYLFIYVIAFVESMAWVQQNIEFNRNIYIQIKNKIL